MSIPQTKPQTSILCVAPFNIPHIMPWYDQMVIQPDTNVTCAVVGPLPSARLQLGWPELDPASEHLQLWRRPADRRTYFRLLDAADVVIFPGFFHFRTLPFQHWRRRLTGKPTLLWSEPFFNDPRTSHNPLSMMARRLLLAPCNSSQVNLLTMGHGAEADYRRLGCRRWPVWRFGYSITPPAAQPPRQPSVAGDPVRLIFCGSLVDYKGVDLLLDALSRPHLRDLPWRLDLIGDGPQRKALAAQAATGGVAAKVVFQGVVPREQCTSHYRQSDILVLPSLFDGWGAVVNEGMENGLAIVASDAVGSARLLVDEGVNGFTFPAKDSDRLAGILSNLLTDDGLRRKLGQASAQRIEQFRPGEAARRVTALCRGLAGHAPLPEFSAGFCSPLP